MKKVNLGLVLALVLALAVMAGFACGDDGDGAEFELSGLTITPSEAGADEEVSIRVTVENVGDDEGSTEVTLKVDGDEVDSQDVTVAAGATRTVTFTHSESAEGTYAIKVDGESGTLTVTAEPVNGNGEEGPGVGSTWEYLNDYTDGPWVDEFDHPYTTTLAEKGVIPPTFLCVPAPDQISCNRYETDTHADGACPPNPTKPKRPLSGYTIVPIGVDRWENPDNLTQAALIAPVCMTAPLPLGLIDGTITMSDYTAVSGTIGYPYAMGDKWTYNYNGNAEILGDCLEPAPGTTTVRTDEVVAVDVSVTVPAGTFTDCVEILTTSADPGETRTWWSPTVQGIVKQVDTMGYPPGTGVMELSAYDLK